jgi:hypothetical protein
MVLHNSENNLLIHGGVKKKEGMYNKLSGVH